MLSGLILFIISLTGVLIWGFYLKNKNKNYKRLLKEKNYNKIISIIEPKIKKYKPSREILSLLYFLILAYKGLENKEMVIKYCSKYFENESDYYEKMKNLKIMDKKTLELIKKDYSEEFEIIINIRNNLQIEKNKNFEH